MFSLDMAQNPAVSFSSSGENWQTTKLTIRERNAFMFNNPLLSDVTFNVRPSETQSRGISVPAHKYVLAVSSPVFCAMFYGKFAEKNDSEIHLPDCHTKNFLEFLRFLYSDEVKLTADSVLEILYLAKKYIVPHLATKCVEYLEKEMNYTNVFEILKHARKFDEEDLVERCWQIIDNNTIDCIQSEAMLKIDHDILESLIKRDTLNVQEDELFKTAKRWAERKCSESGVEATGPEMRRVLGDALFHFRFLAMKPEEFAKHIAPTKICLDSESLSVLMSLLNKPSTETDLLPFSKWPRSGSLGRLKDLPLYRCKRFKDAFAGISTTRLSGSLDFEVNSDIYFFGVRLYAGTNINCVYEVQVELNTGDIQLLQTTIDRFQVERRSASPSYGFDVMFNQPKKIPLSTKYTVNATITSIACSNVRCNNEKAFSDVIEENGIRFCFYSQSANILELLFKV